MKAQSHAFERQCFVFIEGIGNTRDAFANNAKEKRWSRNYCDGTQATGLKKSAG
jgi:hypothetical protein